MKAKDTMKTAVWIPMVLLLAVTAGMVQAAAEKSPMVLFQEALYQEETEGNLDKAIELYQQVLDEAAEVERIAARTTYQLGMCHLKKGDKTAAAKYFRKAISNYPKQGSVVKKAQKQLVKLKSADTDSGPQVISTSPVAFANNVDPNLDKIAVTFNTQMMDNSWSWTGGGDTYPQTTGKPYYNETKTVCTLPVKLEAGKVYWVGINSPSHKNFKTSDGEPIKRYVILFATKSPNGKATPIPKDMLNKAKRINAAAMAPSPKVVSTFPAALSNDIDPNIDKITVQFNTKMMDQSWSWTGGGDTYPQTMGRPYYDKTKTVCTLPVKLEAGKVYWVGINSPSHKNFKTSGHEPAKRYVILFATKTIDGKPIPLPDDLRTQAEAVNAMTTATQSQNASADVTQTVKKAVLTISTCSEGDPRIKTVMEPVKLLDDTAVAKELVNDLDSEENTIRRSAIYVLWRGEFSNIEPAVAKLKKLCSHTEDLTRGMAALSLGQNKIGSSFEILEKMTLDDSNGYARRCGAYALGLMGNPKAKPILEKALNDSDKLVQNNAESALRMFELENPAATANPGATDKIEAEDLVVEGWKLWGQRKLVEAEAKFKKAARNDPDNDGAYQGLGWAQLNQGKKKNAEVSFKKCVKLNPGNSAALNGLGWIEHGKGNIDMAIKWWEKAVKASKGTATASISGLTQVYMDRKEYDKAVKYYQMWLKAEPDNSQAKDGLEKAKQATNK